MQEGPEAIASFLGRSSRQGPVFEAIPLAGPFPAAGTVADKLLRNPRVSKRRGYEPR